MKHLFREYFTYTKRERNGVLALLSLISLLLAFLAVSRNAGHPEKIDFGPFISEIKAFDSLREYKTPGENTSRASAPSHRTSSNPTLFIFDPNTATAEELHRLGLSQKQASALIAFRNKGGSFTDKEDFSELRIITPELYETLEPYILIPHETESADPTSDPDDVIVNINLADSAEVAKVRSIEPWLARNILRLRNALGGFVSKQQLMEVRGMSAQKFDAISSRMKIDSAAVRKINVNSCTTEQLSKHPYISYNVARALVNYRAMHGFFRSSADLRKCEIVTPEVLAKIEPYITCN